MRSLGYLLLAIVLTFGGRGAAASAPGKMVSGTMFITDAFSHRGSYRPQLDLNGAWQFRRDEDGQGQTRGWHEGKGLFRDQITIPGAPQAQGIGEPCARQKNFFFGPFWVRRTFEVPPFDSGKRVWLRIGGLLPAAEIYLNGLYVGYTTSSRTQQRADVTRFVKPGANNLIAIKVCDLPEVRLDGIWEMGECAKNWTGVYRPVACEITDAVSLIDAYVQPRLSSKSVRVSATLSEPASEPLRLLFRVRDGKRAIGEAEATLQPGKADAEVEVKLARFTTWSPNHPKLYDLEVAVLEEGASAPTDRVGVRFGMREITTQGTQFLLNGKPIFLRCFGDNQYYPETLSPPPDKEWYLPRLKLARRYGMNGVKSCVEILSGDYLEAADEAGIMVIQEMPFGLSGLRANRYTLDDRFREYYAKELDGLVRESRNHASIIAYSMSSEMELNNQTQQSFDFFSRDLVRQAKALAPHALVIDCTGYVTTEMTPKGKRETDFYAMVIPTWMKEVLDETPIDTDGRHPSIMHEYNWWSCYPDPADTPKWAHAQLRPFWLETLVKTARANGQEQLIPAYRRNSLRLQALCRKDGIEYTRRSPGVEGYIMWLLIDFGQYCEGLLDDFWQPKNVSVKEFAKSNGDTVIVLAREGNRCLRTGCAQRIPLAVSSYAEESLRDCTLKWEAKGGPFAQSGTLSIPELRQGGLTQAGSAALVLPRTERAFRFVLRAVLRANGRVVNTNDWSFWAFPEIRRGLRRATAAESAAKLVEGGALLRLGSARGAPIPERTPLVVADSVDAALADYVQRGGACLLFSRGSVIENTTLYAGVVSFYKLFRTIPWNAGPGNSGTVISTHPALAAFPHDDMCDLQFVSMIRGVLPMEFTPLAQFGVSPIIRAIDHYAGNRNNAYLLEFKVGRGKVIATTLEVLGRFDERIETRQMFQCLLDYAGGPRFAPGARVPADEFLRLFSPRAEPARK